ncbi:MAG: hypothetical protein IIU73_00125 [Selenomonadales bacterium]|nr:hypothetical protein [Selenomonadales bacterium]
MASLNSVKIGFAKYLEQEVVSVLPPWQKALFGTASALILRNAENIVMSIKDHPLVKAMDVIKPDGSVDVQPVFSELRARAEQEPFTIDFPIIGTMKFCADDVDKLHRMILNS